MTSTSAPSKPGGARVHVQRFGTFLSGMVMPNIGAFIAWGLITAFFIQTGWTPVPQLGGFPDAAGNEYTGLVGPMITYMLPLLLAYTGGKMVYDTRGGVVGAIATMGVIVGSDVPMFIGAMIMGPLAAWLMKKVDAIWDGKIKAGFEMLVNNFSAGILGGLLALAGFFGIAPVVTWLSHILETAVGWLVGMHLLPLASLLVEPGKVLFLNNAINHGVFTPLGVDQVAQQGKSILFLIEANPGPGVGILLAFMFFGVGMAKASAPGAIIIQFFGGIHEIYFPYVLMKPMLIIAAIAGGMTGVAINAAFQTGLRAPASPGSIIAVLIQTAPDSYVGVILSVVGAAAVSFIISAVILRASRKRDLASENAGDLSAAIAQTEANKGKKSSVLGTMGSAAAEGAAPEAQTTTIAGPIDNIVFACDAGMGSSAMGASVLRNKLKKAGVTDVKVTNQAIANLTGDADLVVTQNELTERARQKSPNSVHVSVDNFMNSPKYDEVVQRVKQSKGDSE
ncbi:PTS system D-mannitol-specific IIA component, Fru family /PTS system D-mannitol-specific IIB component, Fru family /PTS system D-mannitol-specific IIC component, Fru family [Paramicrobacterium humi]|uniref:PTS system mannitol-specific EIICB component n=1 Tax=Paramicrobacterium humi TaxID=640635 RepID=A0A1H4J097_9MICO|nr:PTS mannitol transporter subunit IICB [Microbacterium humi]SEB39740.1 PTS system D-mannitol-specific IIA component, Fru family /PTS system D-mannitol-specific IIB component, Fru family /PTS system D-mannitol-specific IIC component, Fru family [Microbacterium humi]